MIKKLDYRCLGNFCCEASKCRRYMEGIQKGSLIPMAAFDRRDKINCDIPFAAFDQRDTVICDGFLPRITSPLPDAERKALDAACSTSL